MSVAAHRVAWTIANDAEPGSLLVRHRCDNPTCCNPAHLELGTHADNMRDKVERGRCRTGDQTGANNGNARLALGHIREIIEGFRRGESNRDIARRLPVGDDLVSRVRTGRAWLREATSLGWVPQPGAKRAHPTPPHLA
jgi:hypothetical protein